MTNKINILHITASLEIGGLEILLLEFLKAFKSERYKISVCVFEENGALIQEFNDIGIEVFPVSKRKGKDYLLPFKLRKLISDKKIDIVHTHNTAPWFYSGIAVSMLKGVHLIHTKHSNLTFDKQLLLKAEYLLSKKTDFIIADARDVFNFMKNIQKIPETKIRLIFNGVNTEKFTQKQETNSNKKIIATIGRLVPIKDQKTLISAFKIISQNIPQAELWLIGDGPLKEELINLTIENGILDKTKFLGSRRDIPDLLKKIDIFALISLSEGLSIGILEAMASGIPVVATRVGGNPEIVEEGVTGFLVPTQSPEELADKILSLIKNADLANSMGSKGRKRVLDFFSIQFMVKQYMALYDQIKIHN